jgi:uncharacterized protein YjbJ (UPF0337 family)
MEITELLNDWNKKKGKLKLAFTTLTDRDVRYLDGKKEEMLEKIQTKLGKTKAELEAIIIAL